VSAVSDLVTAVLANVATWVDGDGKEKPLTLDDIMIITPYNAQVFEIQQRQPGAHVGTVDKFQGQEAAIAIYSTATSSHADAPRGMEFLYSLNRLNVAISRAKCISMLVSSPQIFEAECRTPRQIQLTNAFCRYLELAHRNSVQNGSTDRHLTRSSDRQLQHLAQRRKIFAAWPNAVVLPKIDARCADAYLFGNFCNR